MKEHQGWVPFEELSWKVSKIRTRRWLKLGVILIAAAATLLVVNQIVYGPKIEALQEATRAWSSDPKNNPTPSLEQFGLSRESMIISGILTYAAQLLIGIGAFFIVFPFIILIIDRVNGVVENKECE